MGVMGLRASSAAAAHPIWNHNGAAWTTILTQGAVMDRHSRRILGCATACHMRAELAAEALMGMTQSMSRAANCDDNATMECCFAPPLGAHPRGAACGWLSRSGRLWASLKAEAFRSIPPDRAHARRLIHDCIDAFDNTRRLHSSFGFQSPLDFKPPLAFERSFSDTLNQD
jgi:transposase InsO family protein